MSTNWTENTRQAGWGYNDNLRVVGSATSFKGGRFRASAFQWSHSIGGTITSGKDSVVVEAPGYFPTDFIVLESPMRWIVEVGMKRRRGAWYPTDSSLKMFQVKSRTRSMPRDWKSLLQIQSHVTQRPIGLLVVSVLQSL